MLNLHQMFIATIKLAFNNRHNYTNTSISYFNNQYKLFVNRINNGTGNKSSSIKAVRIFVFIK